MFLASGRFKIPDQLETIPTNIIDCLKVSMATFKFKEGLSYEASFNGEHFNRLKMASADDAQWNRV